MGILCREWQLMSRMALIAGMVFAWLGDVSGKVNGPHLRLFLYRRRGRLTRREELSENILWLGGLIIDVCQFGEDYAKLRSR